MHAKRRSEDSQSLGNFCSSVDLLVNRATVDIRLRPWMDRQVSRMKRDDIVWEWPQRRGLEHLQLLTSADGIKAEGLIVADTAQGVIRFRYSISQGPEGQLRRCGIFVPVGATQNSVWLSFDKDGSWTVDRKPRADLKECIAFDIMDTPFPKTGLVKSLGLEEGEAGHIWVACIDNRRLLVSPVEQQWERIPSDQRDFRHYRCRVLESTSDFYLDERLLVQFSPERWRIRTRQIGAA
jgi:hypothetical protein